MSATLNHCSLPVAASEKQLPALTARGTRLLPLLMFLHLTLAAVAQAQFNYTSNNGTVTITGYLGPGGAVVIPDTIGGLPVTGIGDAAFYNCGGVTSVTIPSSVTSIGRDAFPGCTDLNAITVDALNSFYSSLDGVLFNKSQTLLIRCPGGKAGSYTIPNTVTSIGHGAFAFCTSLTNITIPDSVTLIGDAAFTYCASLTSVIMPNSVTSIGSGAFASCFSLTSVTIPNSVSSIGGGAFLSCTTLSAITVDEVNSAYRSVDGVLFNKSQSLLIQCPGGKAGTYTIPNSVISIGDFAFDSCASLTSVTIPNSVTSIGYHAFAACTSLTSVTIPNGVTSIGESAFTACINLATVTIPNSVASIGRSAFYHCPFLTGVYIQGNAPTVGINVFLGANDATVYYLPGTTGWGTTFAGRPTALWVLPNPRILNNGPSFGVKTNVFGFVISWATNIPVVVEATTNLANPTWTPVGTNTLAGGSSYFSDPRWTNYPARLYRLRSP